MLTIYTQRILKTGIVALSVYYLLSLLWLASKRLVYPYELDWIEGGMLTAVIQILDGHNLYSAPSISYVPFLYAPAYFYLAAISAKILGASLLALRLVSITASLVSLLTIVLIVFDETKSWFWGIASAGLFAGLYPVSRFWFDLARVDSVFVMFFLLFLFSLRRGNSLPWQIITGIFLALTILTKQNGLVMCLPIIVVYFLFDWRHRLVLPLTFALVYGGISLAFILSSNGWYTFYCYSVVFSQPSGWMSYSFFNFIKDFILPNVSIAALLTLFILPFWFFRGSKEKSVIWLVVFVCTIATSYAAKANIGGENNVLLPIFAVFTILFGICLFEISKTLQTSSYRHLALAEIFLCLFGLFQLTQLVYNPTLSLPSLNAYANATKSLKIIKKFHGNVYIPGSTIARIAGKKTFAHPSAILDVLSTTSSDLHGRDILEGELRNAIKTHLFDMMVIMPGYDYFPDMHKYYGHDLSQYPPLDDTWEGQERADMYIALP